MEKGGIGQEAEVLDQAFGSRSINWTGRHRLQFKGSWEREDRYRVCRLRADDNLQDRIGGRVKHAGRVARGRPVHHRPRFQSRREYRGVANRLC